jgi:hypothetical protein
MACNYSDRQGGAIVCGGIGIYGDRLTDDIFEKYDPITNSFSVLASTLFNGETTWGILDAMYLPYLNNTRWPMATML